MDELVLYAIYIIVGGIIGLIFSLLFFRMDEGWKKIGTYVFGAGSSGGVFIALNFMCGISNKSISNRLLLLMLVSLVVSAIISFSKLCGLLKDQDGYNIIRVLDIVMGQKDYMKVYYETRKKEIDAKLNFEEIMRKNEELEKKEKKLIYFEEDLNERKKNLDNQLENGIYLSLPERQKVPVTHTFLTEFPDYTEIYANYILHIRLHTQDFCSRLENCRDKNQQKDVLDGYFYGICTYTISDIFSGNGSNKIRVHFRRLDKKEEYVKLVATTGIQVSAKDLTPIPLLKANMITQSFKNKASMIKSLNSKYHFETKNEFVWNEYLTYTFNDLSYRGYPFLAFGISVKNKEKFETLFYFLNFCKIETILQESIDKIGEKCDIINIITGD